MGEAKNIYFTCLKHRLGFPTKTGDKMTDGIDNVSGGDTPQLRFIKPIRFPNEENDSVPCTEVDENRVQRPLLPPSKTHEASISFLPPVVISPTTNCGDDRFKARLIVRCPLCMILFEGIRAFYNHLRHFRHAQLFPPCMTYVTVMCLVEEEGMPSSGSCSFALDGTMGYAPV